MTGLELPALTYGGRVVGDRDHGLLCHLMAERVVGSAA